MRSHGGPEFGKCVAAHPSGETKSGSQTSVAHTGFAVRPPCIREEIVAGSANVPGIGGSHSSVGLASHESHHDHVLDPSFDRLARGREIPRVLAPKGTEGSFHDVACSNAGEA